MPAKHISLPIDVMRVVLEAAHVNPDHTLWDEHGRRRRAAWFADTLRVSRTWYIAGQQSLYYRVEIVSQPDYSVVLLVRTLLQKPHLARMIKVLHLQNTATTKRMEESTESLVPSIPFITETGRRTRRKKKEKILPRLLGLCTSLTDLCLDRLDLTELTPVLESIGFSLERIEIRRTHELTDTQWESLVRSEFWRNQRAIRFHATNPTMGRRTHEEIDGLDTSFLGTDDVKCIGGFTRLQELEIIGFTKAENLWAMLCVVQPTLTALRCDQAENGSNLWLAPVATTLQTLDISIRPFTPLVDLSLLTRLEHLTVRILPGTRRRPTHTPCFTPPCITLLITVFELHVSERFDPWMAAVYIREVLQAFDFGVLPNLACIAVTSLMNAPGQLNDWMPAAYLLAEIVQRRGLKFRLNVRYEMHHPDMHKIDCFVRERQEPEPFRQEEARIEVEQELSRQEEAAIEVEPPRRVTEIILNPTIEVEPRRGVAKNIFGRVLARVSVLKAFSASVRAGTRRLARL